MSKVQENISKALGIPYEEIKKMSFEEVERLITLKNGKEMKYSKISNTSHMNSGHDSVAIDQNKIRTQRQINANIDRIIDDWDRSL